MQVMPVVPHGESFGRSSQVMKNGQIIASMKDVKIMLPMEHTS